MKIAAKDAFSALPIALGAPRLRSPAPPGRCGRSHRLPFNPPKNAVPSQKWEVGEKLTRCFYNVWEGSGESGGFFHTLHARGRAQAHGSKLRKPSQPSQTLPHFDNTLFLKDFVDHHLSESLPLASQKRLLAPKSLSQPKLFFVRNSFDHFDAKASSIGRLGWSVGPSRASEDRKQRSITLCHTRPTLHVEGISISGPAEVRQSHDAGCSSHDSRLPPSRDRSPAFVVPRGRSPRDLSSRSIGKRYTRHTCTHVFTHGYFHQCMHPSKREACRG